MRKLEITRDAYKFVYDLDAKQFRQIVRKMFALLSDPEPADAGKLRGYDYWRVDVGEFRIVYHFDDEVTYVMLIGKRNGDEVYKDLSRK